MGASRGDANMMPPSSSAPAAPAVSLPPAAVPATAAPQGQLATADKTAQRSEAPDPQDAIAPTLAAVRQRAARARAHRPKGVPVASAQAAAIKSKTEQSRLAGVKTVDKLHGAADKAKPIPRDEFKQKLRAAIDAATPRPRTESEAAKVVKSGATGARAKMQEALDAERNAAAGGLQSQSQDKANVSPSEIEAKAETGLQTEQLGASLAPVSSAAVAPAPLPPERLDYSSDRAPTDRAMAENNITKAQLEKGNEPTFGQTLQARRDAEQREANTVAGYRQSEGQVQDQARAAAHAQLARGLGAMQGSRELHIGGVVGHQQGTQTKNERERQRITDEINGIRDKTRADVADILKSMEVEAERFFAGGLAFAERAYEETFEDAKGGLGTWLTTWGDDWKELIEGALFEARQKYLQKVNTAVDLVAGMVDAKLAAARARVAEGRKQAEDFCNGLETSVQGFGREALDAVSADFDAMEGEIDQRRDTLVQNLTQQYKASYERMEAMETRLREANKSLWERIYDATVGLIKKIIAFKDMLVSILKKAASVILDIISDPIGFLGNLVSAVGLGLRNFKSNIGKHLKKGLSAWVFGEVASAGLQVPETLDGESVSGLAMQVSGVTYANFRARAVTLLGERVVGTLEKTADVFKFLATKGVAALWQFMKEKMPDLKALFLDELFAFIRDRVLIAGVTWIISLLNPASAFFKACKAIYDIVVFFITRGSQIVELVAAVIESIIDIARGSVAGAASKVEDALGKAIPVAIGFLASLLSLGNIGSAVRKIIEKVQAPVNKAIDWVIGKAASGIAKAGELVRSGLKTKSATDLAASREGMVDDPRLIAARELKGRLAKTTSVEHAESEISEVRTLLAPMGLHELILRRDPEGGGYHILAAASDLVSLFALRPANAGDNVQLAAKITHANDKLIGSLEDIAEPYNEKSEEHITGGRSQSLFASPVQMGQTRIGGAVLLPKPGEKTLSVVTWNTSEGVQGTNVSHAELQFVTWLGNQEREWREQVTSIQILVSHSPCGNCVPTLTRINAMKGIGVAVRKQIGWLELHRGQLATSANDIVLLTRANWSIDPPSPMPQGAPTAAERTRMLQVQAEPMPPPVVRKRRQSDKG